MCFDESQNYSRDNSKKLIVLIHPVKCHKATISPKAKLFNRVNFQGASFKIENAVLPLSIHRITQIKKSGRDFLVF